MQDCLAEILLIGGSFAGGGEVALGLFVQVFCLDRGFLRRLPLGLGGAGVVVILVGEILLLRGLQFDFGVGLVLRCIPQIISFLFFHSKGTYSVIELTY